MKGIAFSPIGALIGLAIGAFGGGGSLIAVPVLVYVLGEDLRAAQATSLVIVIAAAIIGLLAGAREGNLRLRAGLAFGAAAAAGSLGGSILSRGANPDLLLLCFAPLMLVGARAMVSDRAGRAPTFNRWRQGIGLAAAAKVVGLGLGTGLLIGVFGVGGGFVIVPALVLALGFEINAAVTTSLLVIIMGSLLALGERVNAGDVNWPVAIPFSAAAVGGALAGRRIAERVEGTTLRTWFAWVIAAAAVYVAVASALSLA